VRKDGKIGMNGLDTSGGSRSFEYYGDGMKRMSRPAYRGRAYLSKRHAKMIGMLLVFVTAIVIVSAMALAPSAKESPAKAIARPLPPPFMLFGQTFDSGGALLYNCDINITNLRSGSWNLTTSDAAFAYYEFDLMNMMDGGVLDGDTIRVTATNVGVEGQNESVLSLTTGFMYMNVTLDPIGIPEFPMVMVPVLGMMALVVVVSLRRRRQEL